MAKRFYSEVDAWIEENQGKCLCACGCGQPILLNLYKYKHGINRFIIGHNLNAAKTQERKFWDHVAKTDSCWLWTGSLLSGYGRVKIAGGRKVMAHRFSWELHRGPIPNGLWVLHDCPGGDNRACVNPDHLFLGNHLDNVRDAQRKGVLVGSRGILNSHCKLSEEQVLEIRSRWQPGLSGQLAKEYGVTRFLVWQIGVRRIWRHI